MFAWKNRERHSYTQKEITSQYDEFLVILSSKTYVETYDFEDKLAKC